MIEFRRTPYRQPVVADRGTIAVGPIPDRHEPRRLQILSIAGPLLAGLVLFAFMRRVEFLALTLLSPVLLVATTLDERRSGRQSRRREIGAFRSMLDDRRCQLAAMREAERTERLAAAPDVAELARRAEQTALDLWPRGRDAEDFLRLRVGTGTLATRFDVALDGGGEQRLREEALAAIDGATTIDDVPITVDLTHEVFAIHGDAAAVHGLLASLVLQAACLHAPAGLVIAAAIAPDRGCDWMKWLPHARTGAIPPGVPHVARSRFDADRLVRVLLQAARRRARAVDDHEPHLLVIIDAELVTDAAAIAPLLELGPAARISVVWIAGGAADVPQHARRVLDVGAASRLWSTTPGLDTVEVAVEPAPRTAAERVALALAPVRDVAAGESGLATDVTLLDVLGRGATSSVTLARWWQRTAGFELRFPIGISPTGPVEIDLVEDGPHVLIAGTTGSGKSELLQSAVTAIAARYSPQRVNFLFVDYKGGAATKTFEHLPHTVGFVSNLDAALARRAIVSLRAELERRMALLECRAKDLRELVAVAPGEAPPSLVIVIDEFATLAKQLPEFVTGVIDIAQRGRSLGVHLVLSTQRLSGAVDENIVANANVRIALRLLDRADSTAMIGSAAAAEIPTVMRGRGVVRIGTQRPVAFQSAYGARPAEPSPRPRAIAIADFDDASQLVDAPTYDGHDEAIGAGVTQQQAVLAAVAAASDVLPIPRPRRPWHEPLASVVVLDELGQSGTLPAIGLFDAPETQEQGPLHVDLERGGGCLIFGSGGAGKTTALRSMALALGSMSSAEQPVAIVAFDCASRGLAMLRPLAHVVDVATGDDLEAISRHIVMLDRELIRRRQILSQACAEHLSAYNAGNPPLPRIVVLIDDIGALVELLGGQGGGALATGETWTERLVRVLVEGRQVGIHGVVTADRRNAVPARLHAAVSNRIVLGHADRLAYADHGVPPDAPELRDLEPGRGWWNGTTVIQLAVASLDHSARGQAEAIERAAARDTSKPTGVLRSRPLPQRVTMGDRARRAVPLTAPLGVEDVTGREVMLDLSASHVAVIGRPRSGKSTALRTIAAGLAVGHELYAVGADASGLASAPIEHAAFGSPNAIASLLEMLARRLHDDRPSTSRPPVLLVDDLELLDDIALAHAWEHVTACRHLRMVAAVEATAMTGFTSNPVVAALKRSRQMLVLQPDDPGEFLQVTGVRLDPRPGTRWVPGRGVLVADRVARVVQVAMCDDDGRRTPVRSRGTVSGVTVISTQSIRTSAVATPTPR
jgi:DNA segregation ATPase FtsK/SpoIIIE, S-DNA-T family